jgi:hypothetical protein
MTPANPKDLPIRDRGQDLAGAGGSRIKRSGKQTNTAPQLQFINSTKSPNEAKSDLIVRRLIRAQARRSGAQKQSDLPGSLNDETHEITKQYDKKLHTSRFKLSTWARKPHLRKRDYEDLQELVGPQDAKELALLFRFLENLGSVPRLLDPVNPLPIPFGPQTKRILQYCKFKWVLLLVLDAYIGRCK